MSNTISSTPRATSHAIEVEAPEAIGTGQGSTPPELPFCPGPGWPGNPTTIPQPATAGSPGVKAAEGAKALDAKVDPRIVEAVNTLTFRLQGVLDGGNSVASGASVAIFLAMMTNGAAGAQVGKLLESIGLAGMSLNKANAGFKALVAELTKGADGVQVAIANSVWIDKKYQLDADFVRQVKSQFGGEARSVDMPSSAKEVNAWVEKATAGMIKDFVTDELMAQCYFAAMNAIYFAGTWTTQFKPEDTIADFPFTKADGSKASVEMMSSDNVEGSRVGRYDGTYQGAKLPYGKDGTSSMLVLIPNQGKTTSDIIKELSTAAGLKKLEETTREASGAVLLPKFTIESEHDLIPAMKKLGIPGTGPYDTVGPGSVSFDVVKQKAKIEVSEKGTKAAAVTGGFALESTAGPRPLLEATQAFVYAIVDEKAKTILFSGTFDG